MTVDVRQHSGGYTYTVHRPDGTLVAAGNAKTEAEARAWCTRYAPRARTQLRVMSGGLS